MQTIHLRWSSILIATKCLRRYDLSFRQNLLRRTSIEKRPLLLGSHVHAGIEAALRLVFERPQTPTNALTREAVRAVRQYNAEHVERNKQVFDYDLNAWVRDEAYYQMMADVLRNAVAILEYQIPRIGLGTRYGVPSVGEVLRLPYGDPKHDEPMIEWSFNVPVVTNNGNSYLLSGTVDTVLRDLETGEYIIFDWKTRAAFPDAQLVDLDGQLRFYAAIIHELGGVAISQTCQYQIRNSVPKPAQLTEKKGVVSMAAISSTWEVWSESVRALGLDPAKYEDKMRPKLHEASHFTKPIFTPVTPFARRQILNTALQIGEIIRHSEQTGNFPGLGSASMGCQFCEFKRLCRVIDFGGDIDFVRETEYQFGIQTDDEVVEVEIVD